MDSDDQRLERREKAMKRDPQCDSDLVQSHLFLQFGKDDEARECLDEARNLSPHSNDIRNAKIPI